MTVADKAIYQQHFGSDPIDIHIPIINPETGIRIPVNFRLTFRPRRSLRSLSAVVYCMC